MTTLPQDFIAFFPQIKVDPINEIIKWFEVRMHDGDNYVLIFKRTANILLQENYLVEPYWVFKALRTIVEEKNTSYIIDNLVESIGVECKKRAVSWLNEGDICAKEDYPFLARNIEINIISFLNNQPAICSLLINDHMKRMQKIERIELKGFSSLRFFRIDLKYRNGLDNLQIEMGEDVTYGQVENGVVFLGIGSGLKIMDIFSKTLFDHPYPQVGLYLIESSIGNLKSFLAIANDHRIFSSERISWFIGSSAVIDFHQYFTNEDQFMPSYRYKIDNEIASSVIPEMDRIIQEKDAGKLQFSQNVETLFDENYDLILLSAYKGFRPLRILGMTSIFTTYLQYCMRDILEGFKELGHEVDILIEKDCTLRLTNLYSYKKILSFKPDLLITICYNRKDLSFNVPERIPFVNFQQDVMPHNLGRKSVDAIKKRDFITVGRQGLSWMEKEGYAKEKIFPIDFYPANPKIYKPVNLTPLQIKKYGSELSFISHGSGTPEEGFNNIKRQFADHDTKIKKAIDIFFDIIRANYEKWQNYPVNNTQHQTILNGVLSNLGIELKSEVYDTLIKLFWHDVSEKYIRQKPLEALADSGIDIALYGAGWQKHPLLGKYSRGMAQNGEELNIILNASKITYHALMHQTNHPRIMDATASKTFLIVKKLTVDEDSIERLFDEGKDFVYFDGPKDIQCIVKYYLNHPDQRNRIRERAYEKVQSYTYKIFAQKLIKIISKNPFDITT